MTDLKITEAGTVQFPMVRHAAEIGWTAISPSVVKQKRGGETEMLFRDELEAKLAEFNPWMSSDAIRQIIERIEAIPPTIEGNREMLSWLRGERQWYDEVEDRQRRVQFVDFEHPANNNFSRHIGNGRSNLHSRKGNRADVMFVINGIPVAIVEHKNPKTANAIERGITQLRRYEMETPELMGTAQLFNVTHLLEYWYGVTWNTSRRFMARWKERQEETYRFAVQSFFEPTDFLRTLRDWILFYVRRWRDAEIYTAPASTPCNRPHRRTLRRTIQASGIDMAHPGIRQNLYTAHRRTPDSGTQVPVSHADRGGSRRS